mmetsp:Transcript_4227/g.13398  ORF Transcript_4227/g.13398 Transcript_4227/m.13398 type:complete len:256 (-) Transcript_4227:2245-3012(-)
MWPSAERTYVRTPGVFGPVAAPGLALGARPPSLARCQRDLCGPAGDHSGAKQCRLRQAAEKQNLSICFVGTVQRKLTGANAALLEQEPPGVAATTTTGLRCMFLRDFYLCDPARPARCRRAEATSATAVLAAAGPAASTAASSSWAVSAQSAPTASAQPTASRARRTASASAAPWSRLMRATLRATGARAAATSSAAASPFLPCASALQQLSSAVLTERRTFLLGKPASSSSCGTTLEAAPGPTRQSTAGPAASR